MTENRLYTKKCKCGCGKRIPIRKYHKWKGIPNYLNGHNWVIQKKKGIGMFSESSRKKAYGINKKNKTGCFNKKIHSIAGRIGGVKGGKKGGLDVHKKYPNIGSENGKRNMNKAVRERSGAWSKESRQKATNNAMFTHKKNKTGVYSKLFRDKARKIGIKKCIKNGTGIFSKESHRKAIKSRRRGEWFKNPKKSKQKLREARAKQVFPSKDTSIEVKIQNFLKRLEITFLTHQYMNQIKNSYQCDILIPSTNVIIECDGNYWHKYPTRPKKDNIRTKELTEKGFKVLRLWESEIKIMDIDDFKKRLVNIEG